MSQLKEVCSPLMEFIKKEYDPYTEITVTMDSITVKQKVERIPIKEQIDNQ